MPVFMILLIIGCAGQREMNFSLSPEMKDKNIDNDLIKAIKEYWHYRKSDNPEKSYIFEYRRVKGYKLDKVYKLYVHNMSKAKVKKVEIVNLYRNSKNLVCVDLKFYLIKPNIIGEKTFYQKDCWIKESGHWYHILMNKLIFKN